MANLNYNVSEKLRKLKKLADSYFQKGLSVSQVSHLTSVSETLITEWHDEFVLNILSESGSRRLVTRDILLKNAPDMIEILTALAKQRGDEQLSQRAATAVLNFASRFIAEDARVAALEQKTKRSLDNDQGFKKSLFDFVSPSEQKGPVRGKSHQTDEEITKAFDRLEKSGLLEDNGDLSDEMLRSYYDQNLSDRQEPVDLFDGLLVDDQT